MVFRKSSAWYFVTVWILLLAACAPQEPGVPVTGESPAASTPSVAPELPAKAVLDAQQWLATQLSVAAEEVQLIEAEQAEWTDSCLGLGRLNESCLQAITPGWRVVFEVNGQRYEVRTDRTASAIRVAPPEGSPGMETGLENTSWNLVSFGPAGAEQSLVEGSSITLVFIGGQAGGSGGCNAYGGSYQVEGNTISFGQITSTLVACEDEAMNDQEQRYYQALETASEYQIEGDQLQISYDDGAGLMIFESALLTAPPTATPGS